MSEISHMHPIWPYENDSLWEIDSDQKESGFKSIFKQKSKKADISYMWMATPPYECL